MKDDVIVVHPIVGLYVELSLLDSQRELIQCGAIIVERPTTEVPQPADFRERDDVLESSTIVEF